jgi:hypothetical protein
MIFIKEPVLPSEHGSATRGCCEYGSEPSVSTTEDTLYIEIYFLVSSFFRRYYLHVIIG